MLVRIALVLSLVAGCTGGGATSTGIEELSCPPDSTLSYASFGKDLVTTQCMSCHDRKNPALGTQTQIQAHRSQILDAAVYTDAMPEGRDLSIEERRLLGEWLACGAP